MFNYNTTMTRRVKARLKRAVANLLITTQTPSHPHISPGKLSVGFG
jgi:hypothetical protein